MRVNETATRPAFPHRAPIQRESKPVPCCYSDPVSIQVFGQAVSRGIAIGRAVLIASSRVDVAHYYIDESRVEP